MAQSFIPDKKILTAFLAILGMLLACVQTSMPDSQPFLPPTLASNNAASTSTPITLNGLPVVRQPAGPVLTPTPDPPHALPVLREKSEQYVVQPNDTLNQIAQRYSVQVQAIVDANNLASADTIEVGQVLVIPVATPQGPGPDFKIIPDSELVNTKTSVQYDINAFINSQHGYLAGYSGEAEGVTLSGAQIVARLSQDYSVNPRLLLAVLEYQSGWVTQAAPAENTLDYPIGIKVASRKGLYHQLAWAADNLNRGYYMWRVNGVAAWLLADGSVIPIPPTINAGTAGVQHFFSQLNDRVNWDRAVSANGLFATYSALFGYPFDYTFEPILPPDLTQPVLQLPFETGVTWAFTGGPHGGWGSGSAWAALDFAPRLEILGCMQSNAWEVAVADGLIVRASDGAVVQDLDGDGFEGTGWTILYMHVESRERVQPGTYLLAGERIGHPSCEGGYSTGTHLHLARRYNGEWIPADQAIPFVLDGWVSSGLGNEYDGYLLKEDRTVEAIEGFFPENAIQR